MTARRDKHSSRDMAAVHPIPSIPLSKALPGDIVLCHNTGFVAKAIRFGQRLHAPWVYSEWNHVAILDNWGGGLIPAGSNNAWVIIEAEAHGVRTAFLDSVGDYIIVSADSFPLSGGSSKTLDRAAMLSFARAAIGARYGFLTIACIVINIFTPRIISFRRPGTLICSGLGMRALEHGGAVSPVDPFQITPGEVAQLAATQQTTRPVS